jgi:hypothetical protein
MDGGARALELANGSLGDQMAGISEMVRCHGPWLWGDRFSIMSPSEASGSAAALLAL